MMPANELKPCPTMGSECRGCPDCPGASSTGLKSGDITNEAARKELDCGFRRMSALGRWSVGNQNFKPGSLRYFDEEIGAHVVSEPGATSYSSTAMAATEFFNGIEWLPVDGDEAQEKAQ